MGRIWTSRNTCEYVPSYVWLKVALSEPVPEPAMDKLSQEAVEICFHYAVDQGGVVGKKYRFDDGNLEYEDNPTVIIDGLLYVTYTGVIEVMCLCEDEDIDSFVNDIDGLYGAVGGKIIYEERETY